MKRLAFFTALAISLLLLSSLSVSAQGKYPDPRGYVNDFANIIPDDTEQKLETALRDYEQKTTNEIAVVTVVSLNGQTVEDYTMGLAGQWKVGKKGKDNGVIILVAPNDRAVRIEVGYGLEPVLTDAKAGAIINKMTPFFKNGKYDAGIELGVKEVIGVLGSLTPEEIERQKKEKEEKDRAAMAAFLRVLMYIGIAVVLLVFTLILRKRISAWRKEKKRLKLLREKINAEIPKVEQEENESMIDLKKFSDKLCLKYSLRKDTILSVIAKAEERSQKFMDFLDKTKKSVEKDPDSAAENLEQAKAAVSQIRSLKSKLLAFDELPGKIAVGLKAARDYLKDIPHKIEASKIVLGDLKKEVPPILWKEVEADLDGVSAFILKADEIAHSVEELNSSAFQAFEDAEEQIHILQGVNSEIEKAVIAPRTTLVEFRKAKERIPDLKKELEEKLEKAEKKSRDSDAGEKAKQLLSQARKKKSEAERTESSDTVNWIVLAGLFVAAISLAEKSCKEAQDDIDTVYRHRHSSSWSSGSSYGHSSGGSFGGFGGGSFGGGGASGHW